MLILAPIIFRHQPPEQIVTEGQDEFEIAEKKKWKDSKKAVGNIIFIGELYKAGLLNEGIMHTCVQNLLKVANS